MKKRVLFVCTHNAARSQMAEGKGGICPLFPSAKEEIRREFPDSSKLAGTDEEIVAGARRIRVEITGWLDAASGGI